MKWNEIEKTFDEAMGTHKDDPMVKNEKALNKACYNNGFKEGKSEGAFTGYIVGAFGATLGMILTVLWQSRK